MRYTVVDLFSGAGGMSYGFHAHPLFQLVGAVDAQVGKPSGGRGTLGCNDTYTHNIGLSPMGLDLREVDGNHLSELLTPSLSGRPLDILLACPPCTGFSRANPSNHIDDDPRNSLVRRVALWAGALKPKLIFMENARELITGNFSDHYICLKESLAALGYNVHGSVHTLDKFGLPQKRERALVIAAQQEIPLRTLESLWSGSKVAESSTTVRAGIAHLPPVQAGQQCSSDPMHVSPRLAHPLTLKRLRLLPTNGGSWIDLADRPEAACVLTPAMVRNISLRRFGDHPDVYGRLWWDRPAVTIKRECSHVGNGRYSHPEQDRLITVREASILQGFPSSYMFVSKSLSNMYRHIGDAVPPLISHQLAWVASWMLTGTRPRPDEIILPNTHLKTGDIKPKRIAPARVSEDEGNGLCE